MGAVQIDTIVKEGVEVTRGKGELIFTYVKYHMSGDLRLCRQELVFEYNGETTIVVPLHEMIVPIKTLPRPGSRVELVGKGYTVLDTFIA